MNASWVVPLDELKHDTRFALILGYPRPEGAELKKRLKELQKLRVEALEFKGDKQVSGLNVLGKGCVGIVLLAHIGRRKAALKVRRVDANRLKMWHEAEMLQKANSVGVGPRLLGYSSNFLLMEFIDGLLLPRWLEKRVGKVRVARVLRLILEQCWLLDEARLDHGELSHAPKHVIIDAADRPFIVDFETASVNRTLANVTSISQFLFINGIAEKVDRRTAEKDKNAIIEKLRDYKKQRSRESFEKVLKACGL